MTNDLTMTLQCGDRVPEITVPAITRDGSVSLADYRGRSAVLLALFRGLY
jgi:peroxiredoxin